MWATSERCARSNLLSARAFGKPFRLVSRPSENEPWPIIVIINDCFSKNCKNQVKKLALCLTCEIILYDMERKLQSQPNLVGVFDRLFQVAAKRWHWASEDSLCTVIGITQPHPEQGTALYLPWLRQICSETLQAPFLKEVVWFRLLCPIHRSCGHLWSRTFSAPSFSCYWNLLIGSYYETDSFLFKMSLFSCICLSIPSKTKKVKISEKSTFLRIEIYNLEVLK